MICGSLLSRNGKIIIGISIARSEERGRAVVTQSVEDYIKYKKCNIDMSGISNSVVLVDKYLCGGYGKYDDNVVKTIKSVLNDEGIALDTIYTGKAFWGMKDYIKKNGIRNKKILFIHTGGQPIFFDELRNLF